MRVKNWGRVGSNNRAWIRSLKADTVLSTSWTDARSETLQPVRKVSARRLSVPRNSLRLSMSAISLRFSTNSDWSGTIFGRKREVVRGRIMVRLRSSVGGVGSVRRGRDASPAGQDARSAGQHAEDGPRDQQRQRHMNHDEQADRGHADEVGEAGTLEIVEERNQVRELHRLPDRKTGDDLHDDDENDADIEQLLHGIVMREVGVLQAECQSLDHLGDHFARADRPQHPQETAGEQSIDEIDEAVEDEHPHGEEVPLQRMLRPDAEHDRLREMQYAEQDLVIVDLPSAHDQGDHRDGIGPMGEADDGGMHLSVHGGASVGCLSHDQRRPIAMRMISLRSMERPSAMFQVDSFGTSSRGMSRRLRCRARMATVSMGIGSGRPRRPNHPPSGMTRTILPSGVRATSVT